MKRLIKVVNNDVTVGSFIVDSLETDAEIIQRAKSLKQSFTNIKMFNLTDQQAEQLSGWKSVDFVNTSKK